MSLESEFDSQWEKFLDIVGTLIHREIENNRRLDSEIVNSIIRSEVDKWSIKTHYNGAWLGNLTRKYPSLGEEFRTALKEMRLSNDISFNLDVPISRYAKLVAIAWATCLILFPIWSAYPFLIKSYSQPPQPSASAKPSPQPSASAKPSPQPSASAKPSPQPSASAKPSPQPSASAKPSPQPSASAKPSPQPSASAKPSPQPSASAKPSPQPSASAKPSSQPSASAKPSSQALQQTKASAWKMVGLPFVRLLLGTAFVAFITFPIFSHLRTQQKKKAVDNLVEQIQKDLETTAQKLRHIVSKADKGLAGK
jgi:hypothetical protein